MPPGDGRGGESQRNESGSSDRDLFRAEPAASFEPEQREAGRQGSERGQKRDQLLFKGQMQARQIPSGYPILRKFAVVVGRLQNAQGHRRDRPAQYAGSAVEVVGIHWGHGTAQQCNNRPRDGHQKSGAREKRQEPAPISLEWSQQSQHGRYQFHGESGAGRCVADPAGAHASYNDEQGQERIRLARREAILRHPTSAPDECDHRGCNPIAAQAPPQKECCSEKTGVRKNKPDPARGEIIERRDGDKQAGEQGRINVVGS